MVEFALSEKDGQFFLKISGHAFSSAHGQKDLVCCSASTLVQNWELSVTELCPGSLNRIDSGESGYYEAFCRMGEIEEILFFSLSLGLTQLAKQFPKNIKRILEDSNGT